MDQVDLTALKTTVSRRTIRDQVGHRLAAMIQSGILREGDELPSERELASTLGVSRETVRGAVQMVAALGMVEISQGRPTRVMGGGRHLVEPHTAAGPVSLEAEQRVYEARRVVELPVIRLAVERMSDDELARLARLVEAQHGMTQDPVRFQISDAELHQLIYRAAGNPVLSDLLGNCYGFGMEYRRRVLLSDGAVSRSLADHVAILDGFSRRDADAAEGAMAEHLDRIHATTVEAMTRWSGGLA